MSDVQWSEAEEARAEEIQRIADICGELSLDCSGLFQYRATFKGFIQGDEPQIVAVQPDKVEGIFESIWLRLKQSPEYRPLAAAVRERDAAVLKAIKQDALIKQMGEALEELVAVVNGECPSLLNEDSGGSAKLAMQIQDALDAWKAGQP